MDELTPIARIESYLDAIVDGGTPPLEDITRVETFLEAIYNNTVCELTPITRIEIFLGKISGQDIELPEPVTRIELYLAAIAGEDVELPEQPITRVEYWLDEWANGGGDGKTIILSGLNVLSQLGLDANGRDHTDVTYFYTRMKTSSFYPVTPGATGTIRAVYDSSISLYFAVSFYASDDFSQDRLSGTSWIDYSQSQTFSIPSNASFIRLIFKNGSAGNTAMYWYQFSSLEISDGTHEYSVRVSDPEMLRYGGLNIDGTPNDTNIMSRIVTDGFIPIDGDVAVSISAPSGFEVSVSFYPDNQPTTQRLSYVNFTANVLATSPTTAKYLKVLVRKSDNNGFSSGVVDNVILTIGGKKIKELGELTYVQSFTKYGGKYYSTDGSSIGVQNADFSAVTSKSLSVGHGNGFQLGNGNIAYISGWDDQKMYAVNLDNLTISEEINLGTTGYTTAVIDEGANKAYIFQRDSYPNTVTAYNFIVYDLLTETVVSTKTINSFGAMQAADLHNGRIAILWGMGTSALPSGMGIYDTSGNILGIYALDVFASQETEGIYIDRETGDITISLANKKVYSLPLSIGGGGDTSPLVGVGKVGFMKI